MHTFSKLFKTGDLRFFFLFTVTTRFKWKVVRTGDPICGYRAMTQRWKTSARDILINIEKYNAIYFNQFFKRILCINSLLVCIFFALSRFFGDEFRGKLMIPLRVIHFIHFSHVTENYRIIKLSKSSNWSINKVVRIQLKFAVVNFWGFKHPTID